MTNKTNNFIKKANKIHGGEYDYSLVDYVNSSSKVKIRCLIHGDFEQRPNAHLSGRGCTKCKSSNGEKFINKRLVELGIEFNVQHRFNDCRYKKPLPFDFYLPKLNTCIEYQGEQHYRPTYYFGGFSEFEKYKVKDEIKIKYCIDNSINLLIIKFSDNVDNKLEEVLTQ